MARHGNITEAEPATVSAPRSLLQRIGPDLLPAFAVLGCAILLIVATQVMNPGAGFSQQLAAVLVTSIFLVVASFGQGLTILLGGIDLSIGVVIGISAMMISVLTDGRDAALPWALPLTIAAGGAIGFINGVGIAFAKVPPFIMTLASGITFFGVGLGFTSGLAQEPVAPALGYLMNGYWFSVPIPVVLIFVFVIAASLFQNGTSIGRKLYAIGSSQSAAQILGLPIAAVAAAIRHPDRPVVCFTGDGDFLMTGQELATAVQYRLPIVIILLNNNSFGTIRMHQEMHYPDRTIGTDLVNPDFAALARAYGAHGETVARTDEFAPAFLRARAAGKPALIEIRMDVDAITPTRSLAELRDAARARPKRGT